MAGFVRILGLVLVFCIGAGARAATLDPPRPELGQRATLTLEFAPADSTEWPRSQGALLRATPDPRRFEVLPIRVGEVAIAWGSSGDTLRFEVPARIDAADPASLRPLASVGELGPNWWPTALLLIALMMPVAVLVLWWLRRHRGRSPVFELPAEPPHEVALRRLASIQAERWPERGEFDRFYVEASHALRAYVGGRFLVPALDWTRDETVARLLAAGHEKDLVDGLGPLLSTADEVKFGRHASSSAAADDWLSTARSWIQDTAVEVVYTTPEAVAAARSFNGERGR